jgi:hypothetical protein
MKKLYLGDREMKYVLTVLILLSSLAAQSQLTPGEACRFTQYSQQRDVARFLSSMSYLAKTVTVQVIGKSREIEDYNSQNLFLCVLSQEGVSTPQQLNRNKITILITASQHGNEQSAKEAAMQLVRDIALGDLQSLLTVANILVIPQANPYGNLYDRRVNELDLDMNRDHIKMESEGVQAIHRVFRTWMPEVTLDVHERGDNYYKVSLGCVSNINVDPSIQEFSRSQIIANVQKNLAGKKITFFEYLVSEEMGINTAAGADLKPEDTVGRPIMMRYSTSDINDGRNSLGLYQTFSFIQEGSSHHDLNTLAERTRYQAECIRSFVQTVAARATEMKHMVSQLRNELVRQAAVFATERQVHLRMDYSRDDKNAVLHVQEFENSAAEIAGLLKTDKKAGETVLDADLAAYPYPAKQKVVARNVENWFPRVVPKLSVSRPVGYVIPAQHQDVVETLLMHGVEVSVLTRDAELQVEGYWVNRVRPSKYDYLPPEDMDVSNKTISLLCKTGDYYVSCAQPAANVLPCLLEPQSDYGMIRYWKYRLVPAQDQYFAIYRVVRQQDLAIMPYQNWAK